MPSIPPHMSRSVELQPIQTGARNRNNTGPYTPSPLSTTFNEADIRPPTAVSELSNPGTEESPAGPEHRLHSQADRHSLADPDSIRLDNAAFAGSLPPVNDISITAGHDYPRRMDRALLNNPPSIAGSTPPPQYERYYSGPLFDHNGVPVPRNSEVTIRSDVIPVTRAHCRVLTFLENALGLEPGSLARASSGTVVFIVVAILLAGVLVGIGAIVVSQVKRNQ